MCKALTAAIFLMVIAVAAPCFGNGYTVFPLGRLGDYSQFNHITNNNLVAGEWDYELSSHPFLWDGTYHSLGAGWSIRQVNSSGIAVGRCGNLPVFYKDGSLTPLPTGAGVGGASSINDRGDIAGWVDQMGAAWPAGGQWHILNGTPQLPYSHSSDINESGDVVGWISDHNGTVNGAAWVYGQLLEIPSANILSAVNDSGVAAGRTQDGHAALWDVYTGNLLAISSVMDEACELNNRMEVVGHSGDHAMLWSGSTVTVLPMPTEEDSYSRAYGINDTGWIVGCAGLSGNVHCVTWVPVPEPAGTVAVGSWLALLCCAIRRRNVSCADSRLHAKE